MPALESFPEIGMMSATLPGALAAVAGDGGAARTGAGVGGAGAGCGTAAGAAGLGSGVVGTREHPASTASAAAALQRRTHRALNIGCATFRAWAGCPFAPPPVAR